MIKYNNFNEDWTKYEFNPVLGNNKTGSLFDPFVIKHNGLINFFL